MYERQRYTLKAHYDGSLGFHKRQGGTDPKVYSKIPTSEQPAIVAILEPHENDAVAALLPTLEHLDWAAENIGRASYSTFSESLETLMMLSLKVGIRIGEARKNAESAKKKKYGK